jgi:hypothetical protein
MIEPPSALRAVYRCAFAAVLLGASLATAGCDPSIDPPSENLPETCEITLTAGLAEVIPTVVHVEVEVDDADAVAVRYGAGEPSEHEVAAALRGDGTWAAVLLGLAQQREIEVQAVVERDGQTWTSETVGIVTGTLSADLPVPAVDLVDPEAPRQGFLVTTVSTGAATLSVILDADGEYVWAYDLGVEAKHSHTWLSRDRLWIYLLTTGPEEGAYEVSRVRVDGTATETVEILENWHHDATERPDGTLDFLVYDQRMIDGVPIMGDQIISLSPDGVLASTWSIWDHRDPPEIQSEGDQDWSHANAIVYDEVDDAWYLSLFSLDEIIKIDRASGEIRWTLGGDASDFELAPGENEGFHHQHRFQLLEHGLVVFDNGDPDRYASRVEEYTLDTGAGTAELAWQYEPDPSLYNLVLGDVVRLDDGHTLVCFSNAGQFDLVDPAGALVWRLTMPLATTFWYVQWVPSLYP